jgi:acyl-coenzyme A thioesterase PaaI-like protein
MPLTPDVNRCFACGKGNPDGLQLDFDYDPKKQFAACRLKLPSRFQGATGYAHGGIIATLLDEAMAKVNGKGGIRAVTVRLEIRYRKMVPLEVEIDLTGRRTRKSGKRIYLRSALHDLQGNLLAEARGLFLQRG